MQEASWALLQKAPVIWYKGRFTADPSSLETGHERCFPLSMAPRSCRRDGRAAREFRDGVEAGMVGVNVPVAQPFAFFPFSGWKGSFYGDLHVHGTDGMEFYTRKKMFITPW
jgi:acyl-CoA reductase-like NAD-dependent aldehyde dehydrogenase